MSISFLLHGSITSKAVNKVAANDATVLLLVWDPKWRGPLPGGASKEEIEICFPDWKITNIEAADEQWYRLCRK